MIVLEDSFNIDLKDNTYMALGSFDGLHIGHAALINKAVELSNRAMVKSMVFTFKNHPLTVVRKDSPPKLLMSNDSKTKIFERLGVDIVNFVPFDEEFMKITPEDFIEKMIKHYNIKGIVVGFNFKFGYKNKGNIELLKLLSKKMGFELYVVEPVMYNNEVVSSSRVRALINNGNISAANQLMLKPYMLEGHVVKGRQLGRTLGFPTANLSIDTNFVLPSIGVYYTNVEYENKIYKGITSVGYNPTITNIERSLTVETFILDFQSDIYDKNIKIFFIDKFRDEIKFNSLEELKEQLKNDEAYAKRQDIEFFYNNLKKNLQKKYYLL